MSRFVYCVLGYEEGQDPAFVNQPLLGVWTNLKKALEHTAALQRTYQNYPDFRLRHSLGQETVSKEIAQHYRLVMRETLYSWTEGVRLVYCRVLIERRPLK